jgi:hypothetical protein
MRCRLLREMLRHSRRSAIKRCKRGAFGVRGRLDRTQEVAGSSPASSIKPPQTAVLRSAVSEWRTSRRSPLESAQLPLGKRGRPLRRRRRRRHRPQRNVAAFAPRSLKWRRTAFVPSRPRRRPEVTRRAQRLIAAGRLLHDTVGHGQRSGQNGTAAHPVRRDPRCRAPRGRDRQVIAGARPARC